MKKTIILIFSVLLGQFAMAENNIPLVRNHPGLDPDEQPRSIEFELTASIDGQVVTVSYTDLVASQIVVRNSANQIVFDQTYALAYSVQANLTSLPVGSYTIYVYVMDDWWYGQFEIE